jgi:predicted RNA binding protein YcfA (HicA-like mRNA interferase family)
LTRRSLPAISGCQLIKLLKKDGWVEGRKANHGLTLVKDIGGKKLVTFIPTKTDSLPNGTLSAILGPKQTRIGKKGLDSLLEKHKI